MKRLVRAALAASVFAAASTTVAFAMGGSGPTPHSDTSQHPSAPAGKITKDVAIALGAAQKAAQAGDMAGALVQIKAAQATTDRTPHDDFVIAQFLSAVAANLRDYPTAAAAYDVMLASPDFNDLSDADKKLAYHDGLVVSENVQQWQKVVMFGQKLDAMQGNDDITYTAMAIAYYNTKDTANASLYAQKAIDMAKAQGKQPQEQALQIQMNGQAQSKDTAAASATLETLAISYNQPEVWSHLTDIALTTRNLKDVDALFIFRARYMTGAMAQGDNFTDMATIANSLGYATEAQKVLEQGINSGKITPGQAAAQMAKARKGAAEDERALASIAAAAERAKTGEQDAKLAEDYWGYGRYADVEAAARRAVAKGGMKDASEGQMMLGIALVAEGKYDDAIQALGQVSGPEGRTKSAHLWSVYAQAKKKQGGGAAPAPAPAATH
jgi:hypothetical protein